MHLLCVHFYLGNKLTCEMINDFSPNAWRKRRRRKNRNAAPENDNRMTLTLLHLSFYLMRFISASLRSRCFWCFGWVCSLFDIHPHQMHRLLQMIPYYARKSIMLCLSAPIYWYTLAIKTGFFLSLWYDGEGKRKCENLLGIRWQI